jgi:hypothetical protein
MATFLLNDWMRMIARSERLKHQSAVMLIDYQNTEKIECDFGLQMLKS